MSVTYKFESLDEIADYLNTQARTLESCADREKKTRAKALYKREAVAYRQIAQLLRDSKIVPQEPG